MSQSTIERDDMMERTRAAVCYVNTSNDEGTELAAFLALFHPEIPQETVVKMVNQKRAETRRK